MSRRLVTIYGSNAEMMRDLVRTHRLDVVRHSLKTVENDGHTHCVDAVVDSDEIAMLKAAGYDIGVNGDVGVSPA